jgi:CRISPR system Cascade subunit CasD
VIGLLGCALGYPVQDPRLETELCAGLRFGIRVENPGRVVQDYQTITGFLPTAEGSFRHSGVSTAKSLSKLQSAPDAVPATIVSPRYYLEDASFLVALEENDGFQGLVDRCIGALESPKWPVYLGRKACVPTRPVYDPGDQCAADGSSYASIEDALSRHPWSWLRESLIARDARRPKELVVMVERPDGELLRQDEVQINQARQYGFRHIRCSTIPMPTGGMP